MKKRLLITSIVMMLVVAVALSTATYAWFTSNANVTASTISMTASTSTAPSLGISWVDGNYGTSITAVGPTAPDPEHEVAGDVFAPACPADLTKGTTLSTVEFNTALATPANGGDMVFLANGTATDVYTWRDATHTSFFLKNLSPSNQINTVTMNVNITGDGASLIRVGVFKKDGENGYKLLDVIALEEATTYTVVTGAMDNATTYYKKYLGKYVAATIGTSDEVTAKTADYYDGMTATANTFYTAATADTAAKAVLGTITANQPVNNMSSLACVTSTVVASNLAAGSNIELVVKVWEDAVALGDAEQGQVASIEISFAAA